jgi:uncharacterized protein
MQKYLFVFLGSVSLCLGIIGTVIPGLPTTPFLLLSAALYIRSSKKLYNWLISTKYLGHYISDFHEKKGMSKQMKLSSIGLMWLMIFISIFFVIKLISIRIIVIAAGIIGTIVMGFIIKTVKED